MASSSKDEHRTKRVKLTEDDNSALDPAAQIDVDSIIAQIDAITIDVTMVDNTMDKIISLAQESYDSICAGQYLIGDDDAEDAFYAKQKAQEDQDDDHTSDDNDTEGKGKGKEQDLESGQAPPPCFRSMD